MSDNLKIVIVLGADKSTIGVQAPNSDPVVGIGTGDLNQVLALVPDMVIRAKAQWQISPKYPKSEMAAKATAPAPKPASTTTTARHVPHQAAVAKPKTEDPGVQRPTLF